MCLVPGSDIRDRINNKLGINLENLFFLRIFFFFFPADPTASLPDVKIPKSLPKSFPLKAAVLR